MACGSATLPLIPSPGLEAEDDVLHTSVVVEEMTQGGGSCAGLSTPGIAIPQIITVGDPGEIDRFVRPARGGRKMGALAVTEPDAGSDVAASALAPCAPVTIIW